jgi:hypothetical protein
VRRSRPCSGHPGRSSEPTCDQNAGEVPRVSATACDTGGEMPQHTSPSHATGAPTQYDRTNMSAGTPVRPTTRRSS